MAANAKRYRDPNGAHIRIYHNLLNSPAWRALSASAKNLFIDLRVQLNASNNGKIAAVFSDLKHRGWRSKTTMHKALRELDALGFIAKTRQGGIASMSRICSLYRFTDLDCNEFPAHGIAVRRAIYDYRAFASLQDAVSAKRKADKPRERASRRENKAKVRKLDLLAPETGPKSAIQRPENGQHAV